jgi:hypothetical protein
MFWTSWKGIVMPMGCPGWGGRAGCIVRRPCYGSHSKQVGRLAGSENADRSPMQRQNTFCSWAAQQQPWALSEPPVAGQQRQTQGH